MNPGTSPGPIRVIGVGNRWRGDDAAGLDAAEALRSRLPAGVEVLLVEGDGSALLDAWDGAESAIALDAMRSGALPGTNRRFDVAANPLPADAVRFSTHSISVPEAVELARALGKLPPVAAVYGIEGLRFDAGSGVSEPVAQGIEGLCDQVATEVQTLLAGK